MIKKLLIVFAFLMSSCSFPHNEEIFVPDTKLLSFRTGEIKLQVGTSCAVDLLKTNIEDSDLLFMSDDESVASINNKVITANAVGTTKIKVYLSSDDSVYDELNIVVLDNELANGFYSFFDKRLDEDQTFALINELEGYVINNHLLGVPLYGINDGIFGDHLNFVKLYVNGSTKDTPINNKRKGRDLMANSSFYDGLIACINRKELAKTHKEAKTDPSIVSFDRYDFVAESLDNGEETIPFDEMVGYSLLDYKDTDYYKSNFKGILYEADECGYSLEKARLLFAKASEELIEQRKYKAGETIDINILYGSRNSDWFLEHDYPLIKKYIENTFNSSNKKLKISLKASCIDYEPFLLYEECDSYDLIFAAHDWNEGFDNPFYPYVYSDSCNTTNNYNTFASVDTNILSNYGELFFENERFTYSALVEASHQENWQAEIENGRVVHKIPDL